MRAQKKLLEFSVVPVILLHVEVVLVVGHFVSTEGCVYSWLCPVHDHVGSG